MNDIYKKNTLERQVSFFLGNFTPKTSNYCLKNRALRFLGHYFLRPAISSFKAGEDFSHERPPDFSTLRKMGPHLGYRGDTPED